MPAKRVALLVETASSWGSQIIAGIADFVRRHDRWMLYLDHRGVYENQNVPREWPSDGIIARVTSGSLRFAGSALVSGPRVENSIFT